ncbi:TPA: hypothetical protein ACH3X1_016334 [Trebouxia sp. C0004]
MSEGQLPGEACWLATLFFSSNIAYCSSALPPAPESRTCPEIILVPVVHKERKKKKKQKDLTRFCQRSKGSTFKN